MAKLPKLYRKIYVPVEWIHDTMRGGEHHQESGVDWVKARRIISSSGAVKWVLAESLWQYCDYDKKNIRRYLSDYMSDIDDSCIDETLWSAKPKYEYDEDELMRIRIQSAFKRNHSVPYKQGMLEDSKAFEELFF